MATVTATPAAGTAKNTVFSFACATVPNNTATGYDQTKYPTEPEVTYVFEATLTGQDPLTSEVKSTNPAGIAQWDGVLFPAAGTWTVAIEKTSDDSTVASTTVVVS